MVNKKRILIENIPTLIWGPTSDKVYIYVHGKMGCKENAEHFAEIAISKGYQVISFDLPEHGERKNQEYSIMAWNAVKDLKHVSNYVINKWKEINLYACSLGAYFSLLAYKDIDMKKCLFQCPVLNMEILISKMMTWSDITEDQLMREKVIPTSMGETLYWDYLIYSKENPVDEWKVKTHILYPSKDRLTDRLTVDNFANAHSVYLTVLDGAEHYFKEEKYLKQLEIWLQSTI
ncbi:alpha/beta hydrolase [Clostridium sp. AL.422]|uniref:alpha/beta hydrolase n=1 Tax=Clostridium TaxID=1485 RepID=UPI00293DC577|nr:MULTISPECIES: alpha/beta hydrolase [unclassified Clostridium]MDV4152397.1 alpha/beta hydrolase [Clostridium sp. AL.422]